MLIRSLKTDMTRWNMEVVVAGSCHVRIITTDTCRFAIKLLHSLLLLKQHLANIISKKSWVCWFLFWNTTQSVKNLQTWLYWYKGQTQKRRNPSYRHILDISHLDVRISGSRIARMFLQYNSLDYAPAQGVLCDQLAYWWRGAAAGLPIMTIMKQYADTKRECVVN